MLLAEAGCLFVGFILYISGVQGQRSICALKGSSVNLPCSAEQPTSNTKWFTVQWGDYKRLILNPVDPHGDRVSYNVSKESPPTLTINNLRKSDEKCYCCRETTDDQKLCWGNGIQLHVSDVQVKVIPSTEGQTVTLMCSTSCPLTEHPAGYIWYKNREFLYQDWSPWYQQLVSSEEAVTYSCAIRGYEDLRAPQVSVDSVTSACFTVTYAKGRMCPYNQTSEDEPCSITYPREVRVQRKSTSLICTTSCHETDPEPAYRWYKNRKLHSESQEISVSLSSADSFSCAVKGLEDLLSDEFCADDKKCWRVNYVSRRICALRGSSVDISSEYSHPNNAHPKGKIWYKIKRLEQIPEEPIKANRVEYHDNTKDRHHILRIRNLRKDDSAVYKFRFGEYGKWKESDFPGVTLVVTDLKVTVHPAEVTEGQRVTLTCSTSCPLNTYSWFFNSQPLTSTENQTKHLVLDPVRSQDTGNYSCAVTTDKQSIRSSEKTLTVQNIKGKQTPAAAAAAGVCAALLVVIILLAVIFWMRKKRTSAQSRATEAMDNTEQNVYEDISSARPVNQGGVRFSKTHTDAFYSTVQPHEPRGQEHVAYDIVNLQAYTSPQ